MRQRLGTDVLELEGRDVEAVGESLDRGEIVERRANLLAAAARRSLRRRIEEAELESERLARLCKHQAELTTTEDADPHEGVPADGSGFASTFAVC